MKPRALLNAATALLVVIFSVIFTLLIAEAVLWMTPLRRAVLNYQPGICKGFFVPDKEMGFDLPDNLPDTSYYADGVKLTVNTNEIGIFDLPYKGEKDYIVLVGDSFTWAYAPFKDKFGVILEQDSGTRVLKAGVGGTGTLQQFYKARKIVRRVNGAKPQLIICAYFLGNDLSDDFLFPNDMVVDGYWVPTCRSIDPVTYKIDRRSEAEVREAIKYTFLYDMQNMPKNPKTQMVKAWLNRHSIVYALIKSSPLVRKAIAQTGVLERVNKVFINPFLPFSGDAKLTGIWNNHLNNILEFKKYSDSIGSEFLLVLIPTKEQVYPFVRSNDKGWDYELPNRVVKDLCGGNNIHCLDSTGYYRKYAAAKELKALEFFWPGDPHLNSNGNIFLGHLIAEYAISNGLIKTSNKEKKLSGIRGYFNALKKKN